MLDEAEIIRASSQLRQVDVGGQRTKERLAYAEKYRDNRDREFIDKTLREEALTREDEAVGVDQDLYSSG